MDANKKEVMARLDIIIEDSSDKFKILWDNLISQRDAHQEVTKPV
jgi:hypothetical protein